MADYAKDLKKHLLAAGCHFERQGKGDHQPALIKGLISGTPRITTGLAVSSESRFMYVTVGDGCKIQNKEY